MCQHLLKQILLYDFFFKHVHHSVNLSLIRKYAQNREFSQLFEFKNNFYKDIFVSIKTFDLEFSTRTEKVTN